MSKNVAKGVRTKRFLSTQSRLAEGYWRQHETEAMAGGPSCLRKPTSHKVVVRRRAECCRCARSSASSPASGGIAGGRSRIIAANYPGATQSTAHRKKRQMGSPGQVRVLFRLTNELL